MDIADRAQFLALVGVLETPDGLGAGEPVPRLIDPAEPSTA